MANGAGLTGFGHRARYFERPSSSSPRPPSSLEKPRREPCPALAFAGASAIHLLCSMAKAFSPLRLSSLFFLSYVRPLSDWYLHLVSSALRRSDGQLVSALERRLYGGRTGGEPIENFDDAKRGMFLS